MEAEEDPEVFGRIFKPPTVVGGLLEQRIPWKRDGRQHASRSGGDAFACELGQTVHVGCGEVDPVSAVYVKVKDSRCDREGPEVEDCGVGVRRVFRVVHRDNLAIGDHDPVRFAVQR